jgi:beta-lactam-binding protein with PASTA domain
MAIVSRLLRLGLYGAIFFVSLFASLYLTSKWIIQREPEVTVPNLVGHDTVYALDLLTVLGLNIKVSGFEWSDTVPKNFIAFQDPPSGTVLKRDRDVKVVLSRGSRTVRVPGLVEMSLRETELVLAQNGLERGDICRVPSGRYPRDTVIAQAPPPLQEVERGRAVHLLVSDGPESVAVAMPDVRLLPPARAVEAVQRLELGRPAIQEVYRPGEPQDVVLGQVPLPGYIVYRDQPIRLSVNRTPRSKELPARFLTITYVVPEGFLKREVSLYKQVNGKSILMARSLHSPGERLQWLVWARSPDEVTVFLEGVPQARSPIGLGGNGRGGRSFLGEAKAGPQPSSPLPGAEPGPPFAP